MKAMAVLMAALLIGAAPATKPRAPATRPAAAPVAPPVAGDWTSYVRLSPAGTFIVGNPRAKVQLVEHLSYTCPHCAQFAADSDTVLMGEMVKSGSVVMEFRPAIHDQVDLATTLLLRCQGPKKFVATKRQIYARQNDWIGFAISFLQNDAHRFALDSPAEQLKTTAQLGGIGDIFREQGMTATDIDRCFADTGLRNQALVVGEASRKGTPGTPTFFINGVKSEAGLWSQLEPLLRAKGAK